MFLKYMKKKSSDSLTKITFKNLFYNSATIFISKIGGFILTIFLARWLLPELFGVYALVLSIVFIVFSFTDLGANETAARYVSDALGKNKKAMAFSYFSYILKVKLLLIISGVVILLILSKFIAYNVFNKPEVFLPLIAATFYILINSSRSFLNTLFYAIKDLSNFPLVNFILHGSKIIFALIALLVFSGVSAVSAVFVAFAASSLLTLLSTIFILKRKHAFSFSEKKTSINKKRVMKYLWFVGISNLSLVVFGSVDTIMLGKFVEVSYIGYYQVAFSLVASLSALFAVSGIFVPTFTQIHGKRLRRAMTKSLRYIFIVSIPAVVGLIFISPYALLLFFGKEYLPATMVLYALSFFLLISPSLEIYSSLFKAKEKTKILALLVFISLVLNIVLNYIFITSLLEFGQNYAILGAAMATLISRGFYLSALMLKTKSFFKVNMPKIPIFKAILSTVVMSFALYAYNLHININILTGFLEIILGISVYFSTMFLIKGIDKEDILLFRNLIRKS